MYTVGVARPSPELTTDPELHLDHHVQTPAELEKTIQVDEIKWKRRRSHLPTRPLPIYKILYATTREHEEYRHQLGQNTRSVHHSYDNHRNLVRGHDGLAQLMTVVMMVVY